MRLKHADLSLMELSKAQQDMATLASKTLPLGPSSKLLDLQTFSKSWDGALLRVCGVKRSGPICDGGPWGGGMS